MVCFSFVKVFYFYDVLSSWRGCYLGARETTPPRTNSFLEMANTLLVNASFIFWTCLSCSKPMFSLPTINLWPGFRQLVSVSMPKAWLFNLDCLAFLGEIPKKVCSPGFAFAGLLWVKVVSPHVVMHNMASLLLLGIIINSSFKGNGYMSVAVLYFIKTKLCIMSQF